jgi:hypothetical protein
MLDKERLQLIVRSDCSFLIEYLRTETNFDWKRVEQMIELGRERAQQMLDQGEPK